MKISSILIVDDDENDQFICEYTIRKFDPSIRVSKAFDGAEALAFSGLCQRLLTRAEKWQKPSFPLTGADVLAAGVPAGPKVGAALSALEEEWVAGNFHDGRAKLLARLEALVNAV